MMANWPSELAPFEAFLQRQGLNRGEVDEPGSFDFWSVVYSDHDFAVRTEREKGMWDVLVSGADGQPENWFDIAVLREFLTRRAEGGQAFAGQIATLKEHWHEIRSLFAPSHRTDTFVELNKLLRKRVQRRYPGMGF